MEIPKQPHKFLSEVTRGALPTGYVDVSQVTREEVPVFLDRIYKKTKVMGGEWIETMVWVLMREGSAESWRPETIQKKAQHLYDDVQALMGVLSEKVKSPDNSESTK